MTLVPSLTPEVDTSTTRDRATLFEYVEARLRRRRRLLAMVAAVVVLALVVAVAHWSNPPTPDAALHQYSAHVVGYLRPTNDAAITVRAVSGPGVVVTGIATETAEHVMVSVQATENRSEGPHSLVGTLVDVVIPLRQPLGNRTVIEPFSGRPLHLYKR